MDHVPDTLYNSLLAARDLLELFPYDLDLSALHYPSNYLTHYRKPLSLNEFLYRAVDSIEDVFFKIDDGGIKSIKAVSINGKFSQTSPLSKVLDPFLAYLCDLGRESFESFAPGVGRDTPSFSRQNPVSCQRLVNWLGWLIHGGHRFYQSDGVWKTYPSVLAWYRDQGGTLQGSRAAAQQWALAHAVPNVHRGLTSASTAHRHPPEAQSQAHPEAQAHSSHSPRSQSNALSLAHAGAAQPSLVLLSQRQQSVYRMMKTA